MTISKRVLNNWRKEALLSGLGPVEYPDLRDAFIELNKRILQMTQELIDQQLIKEHKEKQNVS